MKRMTTVLCVILCLATLLSLTGCYGDTSVAAYYKDQQMPAGLYISYLFQSYTEIEAKKSDDDDNAKYLEALGGKTQKQWVIDRTQEYVQQYYAIEDRFAELGLEITDADNYSIDSQLSETLSTMSALYTKYGISNESARLNIVTSFKASKIFELMYGEGGEREIPEDEVWKALEDNFVYLKYVSVPLLRSRDSYYTDEQEKQLADKVKELVDRANAGEMFDELATQLQTFLTKYDEMLDKQDAGEEVDTSFLTEVTPVTVATETNGQFTGGSRSNETVIENDEGDLYKEIAALPYYEASIIHEEGYYLFFIVHMNILENSTYKLQYRTQAMSKIKSEEYTAYLKELGQSVSSQVTYNNDAVNRYNPDRMF